MAAVEATSRDFGSFPSGVFFEEGEFFSPLHDGIFFPCQNGLSLISTSMFNDQFPRRIFVVVPFFQIHYL